MDCDFVILAGGLGTRLASAVADRSKVVAEVDGRPFLSRLLEQIEAAGGRRAVLCTGHRADSVERALGTCHGAVELVYSKEASPLGTAGAVRLALPLLERPAAMVLNGDSFCGVALSDFYAAFTRKKRPAAMVLARVPDSGRFGRVWTGWTGRVKRFAEKKPTGGPGWINAGIYLLRQQLLESVPAGRPMSLEKDMFPAWISKGITAYRKRAPFLDIGTPGSYAAAAAFFQKAS